MIDHPTAEQVAEFEVCTGCGTSLERFALDELLHSVPLFGSPEFLLCPYCCRIPGVEYGRKEIETSVAAMLNELERRLLKILEG